MRRARGAAAAAALGLGLSLLAPGRIEAQRADSATVVPGAEYRASGLKAFLLGEEWRPLWTTPIRVPVLDPDAFAGGLRVEEVGGGNQTVSLQLRGADGREYRFRSVNKDLSRNQRPDLVGTLLEEALQDQTSSLLPGAPVAVGPLLDAAGVLHAPARLYVMPDHPFLGEHRRAFAGLLGTLEERPAEGATGVPGLVRAADIEGAEDFLDAVEESAAHRVDARDFLTGRLVDFFVGDWDRHEDQYRWARFDSAGLHTWRAVPRDRDYAFVDYDGFVPGLIRSTYPKALRFKGDYGGQLPGLTESAVFMDRRFLAELERPAWDSIAVSLRARLTDRVIDATVAALPAAFQAAEGQRLGEILRSRRDRLPEAAEEFYLRLAGEPEVHARNSPDLAVVDRFADGTLEVRLFAGGPEGGAPYFRRRFVPGETREVRVFLLGGDDRAVVRGQGSGIGVRVLGGPGGDALADSSAGGLTAFYDHEGENRITGWSRTVVDERAYEEPEFVRGRGVTPQRNWGRSFSLFGVMGDWRRHAGPVVGVGPSYTRWGFRRYPNALTQSLKVVWAPLETRFGVEYDGVRRKTGSDARTEITARATEIAATAFRGFGNDTPEGGDGDLARVWERQLFGEASLVFPLGRGMEIGVGPTVRYTDPEVEAGSPADLQLPAGRDPFWLLGAHTDLRVERRDSDAFPTRGFVGEVAGRLFPVVEGEAGGSFGRVEAEAATYLPLGGPVLALRAGGARVWGDFPFQYAAFVGGGGSLRGHSGERFAGDASAWGGAELRAPLFPLEIVVNGRLGVLALADAGRVWMDGDSPGGWHTAVGGGVFFTTLERATTVSLTYARGERDRFYFGLGVPF